MKNTRENTLSPKQRALNILLAIVLVLGLSPITAFGEVGEEDATSTNSEVVEESETSQEKQNAVSEEESSEQPKVTNSDSDTENKESVDKNTVNTDDSEKVFESHAPSTNKTESDEKSASAEKPKPLYIELYGDGLDSGAIYSFSLEKQENGSWNKVKNLQLRAGENQNNKFENLESGTYRVVYKGADYVIQDKSKVAVDGFTPSQFDSESGFKLDNTKETTLTLTMDPIEPEGEDQDNEATEGSADKNEGNSEESVPSQNGTHETEKSVTDVLVKVEGATDIVLTLPSGEVVELSDGDEQLVSGNTGTYMLLEGTTDQASDINITSTSIAGTELEHGDTFNDVTTYSKEITFGGTYKIVTVKVGELEKANKPNQALMMMAAPRSSSNPYVGEEFTGRATVTHVSGGNGPYC